MTDTDTYLQSDERLKRIFIASMILISLGTAVSLAFELYYLSFALLSVPFLTAAFLYFQKYSIEIFIITLFFSFYFNWSFKIQLSLIVAVGIIFYYFTTGNSGDLNKLKVPSRIKYSGVLLVISVFLSSFLTPYLTFSSIYYGFLFFIFVFFSYAIFRLMKDVDIIDRLLYLFAVINAFAGIVIIFQIIYTGNLRSLGPASFPQMDFAAMALITILFRNFLLSKTDKYTYVISAIVFVILITTQSRFAWLGFLLTFIYGLIICSIFSAEARGIIRKRLPILMFAGLIAVSLVFILGLDAIFLKRLGSGNFTLFEGSEDGGLVTNSLESRIFIWIVAVNTFIHNPLFGVGYLKFPDVSMNYNILPDFVYNIFVAGLDAHTTYLNFLCETGIVGLTLFVTYVGSIFMLTLRAIRISTSLSELKVSIILNLLVFFVMIHSVYSGAFTMGQNALHMHFIFGLAVANYAILAVLKNKQERLLIRDFPGEINEKNNP